MIALWTILLVSFQTLAAMPEKEYRTALQLAEKKVQKQIKLQNNATSLSASTRNMLFGRFYRVGDNWDVVSWSFKNPQMRKTSDPLHTQKALGEGGIFHYEVTRVSPGP